MKFKELIRFGYGTRINQPIVRVMKLTILLITTFLMQVSAAGLAQNVSFTQKNASLKQLFTEIRKQTGYNVFWQEDKVNDQLKFNASFNNATLEEVLNKTLYPQSLTYTIVNQTVVVKRKDKQFLDRITDYFKTINISGKILDAETNLPIAVAIFSIMLLSFGVTEIEITGSGKIMGSRVHSCFGSHRV